MNTWLPLTVILVTAHALGDFVLQTAKDANNKRRLAILAKHGATHAALAYLLLGQWHNWQVPAALFLGHSAIDWLKEATGRKGPVALIVDQVAHAILLVSLAGFLVHGPQEIQFFWHDLGWVQYEAHLSLVAGFIITVRAGSFLIAAAVMPYQKQLETSRGLDGAGSVIGQLERALIFCFLLANSIGAIGFLVAAKSVFRFGELSDSKNRKDAEYILIGTLLSFGFALATSYATQSVYRMLTN